MLEEKSEKKDDNKEEDDSQENESADIFKDDEFEELKKGA